MHVLKLLHKSLSNTVDSIHQVRMAALLAGVEHYSGIEHY